MTEPAEQWQIVYAYVVPGTGEVYTILAGVGSKELATKNMERMTDKLPGADGYVNVTEWVTGSRIIVPMRNIVQITLSKVEDGKNDEAPPDPPEPNPDYETRPPRHPEDDFVPDAPPRDRARAPEPSDESSPSHPGWWT